MNPSTIETAAQRGYVTTSKVKDRAADEWYRYCFRQRRPYIHLRRFIRNATVMLDMDPTQGWLTDDEERWIRRRLAEHGGRAGSGCCGLHTSRIPLAQAEILARSLAHLMGKRGVSA